MSIKASIRNFNDIKAVFNNANSNSSNMDTANISMKLNHISKMLEDSVMKFTERYLIVSTELEEMKREFISNSSLINEYLILTKKEIRFDNFNQYLPGKSNLNIAQCPNYEQKCLMRSSVKNITRQPPSKAKSNSITTSAKKIPFTNSSNSLLNQAKNSISPETTTTTAKLKQSQSKSNINNINSVDNSNSNNNNNNTKKTPLKTRCQSQVIAKNNSNTSSLHKTTLTHRIMHNSNLIVSSNLHKQDFVKPTLSLNDNEKQQYHNNVISLIKAPKTKALYTLINKTKLLTHQEQITTIYLNKEQLSLNLPSNVLNEKLNQLNNTLTKLELNEKALNANEKSIIDKLMLYPSSHAEKGLNVLTKERESELIKNDTQVEIELVKMLFICLNRKNEVDGFNTNANAYDYLFRCYGVNSIKSLIRDVIYKNVYCDLKCENLDEVVDVIEGNKDLMADILTNGTNKSFSYVTNSLQDVYEFLIEAKDYLNNKNNTSNIKHEIKRINQIKYTSRLIEDIKNLV